MGRYPSTIRVLTSPPSRNAVQAMMNQRATRRPRTQAYSPAVKMLTVNSRASTVAMRKAMP
ncbi:hypothetical protein D3C80_2106060 [compost metagenome]